MDILTGEICCKFWLLIKNSFCENTHLEYIEKFDVKGNELKDYITRKSSVNFIFAKIYIKTKNNEEFITKLQKNGFTSFGELFYECEIPHYAMKLINP